MSNFESLFSEFVPIELKNQGDSIVYSTQAGVRTISAILLKDTFQTFYKHDILKDYDAMEIMVAAGDDTTGVTSPKIAGRNGAGDTFYTGVIDSGIPFYVHDIIELNNCGYHRLYCTTSRMIPDRAN